MGIDDASAAGVGRSPWQPPASPSAVDLQASTARVLNQNGSYSTYLFQQMAEAVVRQSVHPLCSAAGSAMLPAWFAARRRCCCCCLSASDAAPD